jgi:ribosomal protein L11 methyltransferase
MAFGTGDHPTTVLCLEAVDEFLRSNPGGSVLDVGTGSGVLAIAAKKLRAGRVVALDTDPVCVAAARENCRLNRTLGVQVSGSAVEEVKGLFDLVVANILANTLVQMAPVLRARTKKRLVLSGLLVSQQRQLEAAYRRHGFKPLSVRSRGEWLRVDFQPT